MSRTKHQLAAVVVALFVLNGCASTGTGDPVVVKAEDVLVNSLSVYGAAMNYHVTNSTKESPAVYAVMEAARAGFPKAWDALDKGIDGYKQDKDAAKLEKLMDAVRAIVKSLRDQGVL